MADYTWLDYLIFALFFFSTLMGFSRGTSKEIVSTLSIIFGVIVSVAFTKPLATFVYSLQGALDVISVLSSYFSVNETGQLNNIVTIISLLVLFSATYFTCEAINTYMPVEAFVMNKMGALNRVIGAALGFFRGYVFSLLFIVILALTPITQYQGWTQSSLIPELQPAASKLGNMIQPSQSAQL